MRLMNAASSCSLLQPLGHVSGKLQVLAVLTVGAIWKVGLTQECKVADRGLGCPPMQSGTYPCKDASLPPPPMPTHAKRDLTRARMPHSRHLPITQGYDPPSPLPDRARIQARVIILVLGAMS